MARRIAGGADDRARLHLRGRGGPGPGGQVRLRPDARAPPRRGCRRPRLGRLPGTARGTRDRALVPCRPRRDRRLAEDARQARRRGDRPLGPGARQAPLRRRRDRAGPRPGDRRPALPAERPGRDGLAPLLRRGVCRARLRPAFVGHDRGGLDDHARRPRGDARPAPRPRRGEDRRRRRDRGRPARQEPRPRLRRAAGGRRPARDRADHGGRPRQARRRRPRRAAIGDPLRHGRRRLARPRLHPGLRSQPHPRAAAPSPRGCSRKSARSAAWRTPSGPRWSATARRR